MTDDELKAIEARPPPYATAADHRALVAEVRRLRDESAHWKRIAMLASGFAPDICDALMVDPPPPTEAEMERAKVAAEEWARTRGAKP